MDPILVLYGTTEGHTAKVANAIAETIHAAGAVVHVVNARSASPDPGGYAGIVVAASVHARGYQPAVRHWVRTHADALRDKPTAFVSVCLAVLQHDPAVDREITAIMDRFFLGTHWTPTTRKVVAGALPYTKYHWLTRWIMRRISAKAHGDVDTSRDYEYTDWADVQTFAREFYNLVVWRTRRAPPAQAVTA